MKPWNNSDLIKGVDGLQRGFVAGRIIELMRIINAPLIIRFTLLITVTEYGLRGGSSKAY